MLAAMTSACSPDASFQKAYSSIDRARGPDKLIADLLRLDQEYPDRFPLKHDIGLLLLQNGDPVSAGPYLSRALTLSGGRRTASEISTLYGGLAIVAYANRDFPKSVEFGKKALNEKTPEADPFGFITGRALLAQNKQKEALEYLDAAWAKARPSMSPEDYRAYARALEAAGRSADVVAVLAAFEASYPYEPGLGLMQSAAYERLGDFDAAVLCAFKEAEYGTAYGASRAADVKKNLGALGRKLDDKVFNPSGKGKTALAAVSAFARKDWKTAGQQFEQRKGMDPFEKYMLLSAYIEAGRAGAPDMEAYAELMPSMRSLPPYFYRLYLGLKALATQNTDRLADILETAINLSPRTEAAREYRTQLAVLLGLSAAEGARLATRAELTAAADKAATTGESSLLDPLVATLEWKDNRTTLMAVGILRAFAKDARHRPYFIDAAKSSTGRKKERLTYILAS
jgi:hypothetical protein